MTVERTIRFNRRTGDVALAAAVALAGLVEVWANGAVAPKAVAFPGELGLGVALAFRRRFPLLTLAAVLALGTVETLAGVPVDAPWVPLAAYMIATYSLVTCASNEHVLAGAGLVVAAVSVQVTDQHKGLGNFAFAMVFLVPIYLAGRTIRARTERADELEREQTALANASAESERRRIARELHDVISHSLGVLVLQAGAAEQVLDRDPEQAREALRSIRVTGQEAIGELGTLLAVARGEVESSREPNPSLADVTRLVANIRQAGLQVDLVVDGTTRELPPAVELSAYRIVQEGLTNALKHARARSALVRLVYGERELEIEVSDDGAGAAGAANARGGRRGLAGVSERVSVFGGRFDAGPRAGCGWTLRAVLPLPR
jgi:signal transduction histidine kinase